MNFYTNLHSSENQNGDNGFGESLIENIEKSLGEDFTEPTNRVDALDCLAKTQRNESVEQEILTLGAQINAATYRFIKLLAEFDNQGGWCGDGIKSYAHWLNWKLGMGSVMAREYIRVARALPDLPRIEASFAEGQVSYTKVRAMTRVVTPESEDYLLEIAAHGTGAHVESLVRKFRRCKQYDDVADTEHQAEPDATLSCYPDDQGMFAIHARLRLEDGLVVEQALNQLVEAQSVEGHFDEGHFDERHFDERHFEESHFAEEQGEIVKVDSNNVSAETFPDLTDYADSKANALVRLAEHYLANQQHCTDSQYERYQVFLHIEANPDTCSAGDQHHFVEPEVARQLACDAGLTTVLQDKHGKLLNIGRKSRSIPRHIRHALRIRDHHACQYPGCTSRRFTDAHHVKHWADGGTTSLDNLITLCRFHHRELHKGTYRIEPTSKSDLDGFIFIGALNQPVPEMAEHYPGKSPPLSPAKPMDCLWLGESMDYQHAIGALYQFETTPSLSS